ncbi:MAG: glycosyltransferase involved in cell wall biosynthesis, partial [Gammaproteobacteria bacterium]
MHRKPNSLTIVIPALDEQASIGSTIERCLAARTALAAECAIGDVEVIVVSDGSSDETARIAAAYTDVTVFVFIKNRGYGAAIKCGFEYGHGDLVAFLDADGTCDPLHFVALCRRLLDEDADLVLGSRVGADSQMPFVRTVGNKLFALMLGILSKQAVADTASGMRVIRREALPQLYPLPDGLHFTPAMSARVLLENRLKLIEVPMSYAERSGRSKLSVVRDGVRFLGAIMRAALCYRPARPLLIGAAILALFALLLGAAPATMYLRQGRFEEWMIYRILLSSLLATMSAFGVCAAVLGDRIARAAHGRVGAAGGITTALSRLFDEPLRWWLPPIVVLLAVLLVGQGLIQYAQSGAVTMHWSRAVLA